MRGRAVPIGALVLAACLSALYLLRIGDLGTQAITCWLVVAVFASAMTWFAFQAARPLPRGDPQRRFWLVFGGSGVVFSLGEAAQLAQTVAAPTSMVAMTGTGLARTVALGCGGLAIVIVLFTYPLPHRSPHDRLCYQLDLATVLTAAGAYGLYFTRDVLGAAAGPVVAMLAAFATGRLYLSGVSPFRWYVGVLGPVAAVAEGLARALGPELARESRPGPIFAMSVLSHALLMIAAWLQYRQPRAVEARARRRPYSLLPYGALAAVYALLVTTLAVNGLDLRAWVALLGALACGGIVVARQLTAFIDNTRLLAERDALTERLHAMAFTDSLTGLANRASFLDRLATAGAGPAVLLVDLDDFKPVNDRFGHAAGDAVLVETARRLRAAVRDTDLVARLGGDEFAVLLEGEPPGGYPAVADRIVRALTEPCQVTPQDWVVTPASVGLATGGRAEDLLNLADQAMYQAKTSGKGSYRIAG
ncbi:GGDEF domain-containing protein [Actinoplanes sp. DH11]|uniref:GGDEF domain-containing protein n=1 Tax=Actinoplanes sp. DH11 TaxID=2857011 RepID=UPI0027154249|nr:GGDEF domain-containing protein [Actinoplanes sp. DH11]